MNNIIISIIVPVYNAAPYIHRCLNSIISQTYNDWECILVDDGSTDRSGAICDEYAQKDARFVVVHKQNEGVAKARITAFEHSKGELITFIDSDDYVSSEYLAKLSNPILEDDADMVSCDYCKVENDVIKMPRAKLTGYYEGEKLKDFIENHYFYDIVTRGYGMACFLWTKMVKRTFVLIGLKNGLGMWFGEDQVSMFTMLMQCEKLVLIPDRLYCYVQHEGQSVMRYDDSLWTNIIKLMSKYQFLFKDKYNPSCFRKRIWWYIERTITGKMSKANMDRTTFISHLSNMRNDPFMKTFFVGNSIDGNWKSNLKYWFFKLKLYGVLYHVYVSKR